MRPADKIGADANGTRTNRNDPTLDGAAAALADAQRIDWAQIPDDDADDEALEGLRLLEDVASAFRDAGAHIAEPVATPSLFDWGPLHVRAPLGRGAVGEVWRAFDPALQREVALKLRPARTDAASNAEFLAEARHLAQLRHRHVLAVYGADLHDDRAGLWTELVEGRTLASVIAQEGPLAPGEALRIAHELAGALVAIHGAGLIHGDVKAENVIREAGGRSVLMDFGSAGGSAEVAARSVLQATPRYLPPEVRDGKSAPSPAIDVYALGVLLHFLLTGRYPDPQQPLAALRPDLDPRLVQLVNRALCDDPAKRPQDARQLAAQLAGAMAPPHGALSAANGSRLGLAIAVAALAFALVAIGGLFWRSRSVTPPWQPQAVFLDPVTNAPRRDGAALKLGDQIALRVEAGQPAFVYVLNEDAQGRVHLLFPVAALDQGNPLPTAQASVLPGRAHGEEVSWAIDSTSAREEFVALVSPQPLPKLEARLAQLAPAQESAPRNERGVGELAPRVPQAPALAGAHLRELVALAQGELGERSSQLAIRVLAAPQQHD